MKTIRSDEEAVSPVIGVILMVAIVVILAAVIAAFVFGMAGTTTTTKVVGLVVTANGTGADIVWQGGADINKIASWSGSIDGTPATGWVGTAAPAVGSVSTTTSSILNKRVIVNATFTDGGQQVIYDRKF